MTYLNEIEALVRADGSAWKALFRQHEAGGWMCILLPSQRLSEADYRILCARLSATDKPAATPHERLKNRLHAHAAQADKLAR